MYQNVDCKPPKSKMSNVSKYKMQSYPDRRLFKNRKIKSFECFRAVSNLWLFFYSFFSSITVLPPLPRISLICSRWKIYTFSIQDFLPPVVRLSFLRLQKFDQHISLWFIIYGPFSFFQIVKIIETLVSIFKCFPKG